jgi:hypothetical protein
VRYDEYCGHGSCRNFAELSYLDIEELDYLTSYKIDTVTEHKHLGLQLSDDGNWNKHIDMITKKAFSRVNILRNSVTVLMIVLFIIRLG